MTDPKPSRKEKGREPQGNCQDKAPIVLSPGFGESSRLAKKIMCFKLGYNFKNGKLVRVMKESGRDDREEEECKGLLLKEIERWKKQQEKLSNHVEAPSASTTTPSKRRRHLFPAS